MRSHYKMKFEPEQPAQVIEPATTEPVFNDTMSLADPV